MPQIEVIAKKVEILGPLLDERLLLPQVSRARRSRRSSRERRPRSMDVFVGQHDPGSSPGHRQPHCQHHVAHGLKIKSYAISGGEGVVSEAHGQGLEKGCDEGGRRVLSTSPKGRVVKMRAMASARGRVGGAGSPLHPLLGAAVCLLITRQSVAPAPARSPRSGITETCGLRWASWPCRVRRGRSSCWSD